MHPVSLRTTRTLFCLALAAACTMPAGAALADDAPAAETLYAAALADSGRPAIDRERDADRKPAEMLAFANLKPGQTVVDIIPGKGYFTRIFSAATGSKGAVYAVTPQLVIDKFKGKPMPPPVSAEAGRGNVHEVVSSATSLNLPAKADLVWTAQNYHDIHIWAGKQGARQLNAAVFNALKPGGLYVIIDHAGAQGLDETAMAKLHRIDEAVVKQEVLAAGFVLEQESPALRNPADARTAGVFDPAIRGKTDQFILRFRKPE